ncbi:MAG TPA: hypothetical protein VHE08_08185 [Solirubrobacterales bacterium]|nr:hypothetical protein [Solirubrobacterales bacterium]
MFRLDETAVVIGAGSLEPLLQAAEACPAVVISIVDEEAGAPPRSAQTTRT